MKNFRFLLISIFPLALLIYGLYLWYIKIGLSDVIGKIFVIIALAGFIIGSSLSFLFSKKWFDKWIVWLGLGAVGIGVAFLIVMLLGG
jgi:hypothetical protein